MKYNQLIRLLKKDGWFVIRQTGSHLIMGHHVKIRRVICLNHGSKEVGKGLEIRIKKDAGLL
ncbi:MAG TPA: type II toxin-antitoxin system HicA family toxin [Puia sp.]